MHKNSGATELFPYLHRYSPAVLTGLARNRKLLQGLHFLVVTDWHGSVVSDQHDEQSLAAVVALKYPRGQAKQMVEPLVEAYVPCRQPIHAVAPGPMNKSKQLTPETRKKGALTIDNLKKNNPKQTSCFGV